MVNMVIIVGDEASALALKQIISQHTTAPISNFAFGSQAYLITLIGSDADTLALKTILDPLVIPLVNQNGIMGGGTTPAPDTNPVQPAVTIMRVGYSRSGTTLSILAQASGAVAMRLAGRNGTIWNVTDEVVADTVTVSEGGLTYNKRRTYANVPDGQYTLFVSVVGSEAAPTAQNITLAASVTPVATPAMGIGYRRDGNSKSLEIFALVPDGANYYAVLTALSGSWTGTNPRTLALGSYSYFGATYNRRYQYDPGFVVGGVDVPSGQYSLRIYREGDTAGGTTITLTLTDQNAEGMLIAAPSGGGSGGANTPGTDDATFDDETASTFES